MFQKEVSVHCGHGATFLDTHLFYTCSDITPAWSGSRGREQHVISYQDFRWYEYCGLPIPEPFPRLACFLLPHVLTRAGQTQTEMGSASLRPHRWSRERKLGLHAQG